VGLLKEIFWKTSDVLEKPPIKSDVWSDSNTITSEKERSPSA